MAEVIRSWVERGIDQEVRLEAFWRRTNNEKIKASAILLAQGVRSQRITLEALAKAIEERSNQEP